MLIRMGNMTAKVYVNRQGGIRFYVLNAETEEIMTWAEHHIKSIQAIHIPGLESVLAGTLESRKAG